MKGYPMEQMWAQKQGINKGTYTARNQWMAGRAGSPVSFQEVLAGAGKSAASKTSNISTPMDDIFEEAARTYGVDVNLLKAIGKAESNFDSGCTSSAGAMGVMQLMPGTAKSLGVTDPYDARQNIMGGASYIADKIRAYDGNIELALAAYNAGSGNVAKYGGVPPFKETQNYVKKVMNYAGEDIQTQANVSQTQADGSQVRPKESSMYLGQEMSLRLVEMMKMQMEMKLSQMIQGSFGEEDKDGLQF